MRKLLLALLLFSSAAVAQPPITYTGGGTGTTPANVCGDAGHALAWNGSAYFCQAITGGSAGAGGSNTQINYNQAGALAGITGATTDGTSVIVSSGNLKLSGATSGTAVLNAPATGGGTLTLPGGTDSIVSLTATQTLTNKTLTAPVMTVPVLGTPASGTLTNATGLPVSTGVSGLGSGVATALGIAKDTSGGVCTVGGGACTGSGTPGGSTTQLQYNNAGSFGGISGATSNGTSVTLTSPTLVTPALGTPASGTLTNATGLPISTGVSGLGTGVATALGTNVGSAGAPVVNGGALGTPSSGTLTNATGLIPSSGVAATGTPSSSTYLRGDNTWSTPAGAGNVTISPASGNTAGNAVVMSNTTTTVVDAGYAPAAQSSVTSTGSNQSITSSVFNPGGAITATGAINLTFSATSGLSRNGSLFVSATNGTVTLTPNGVDQVCVAGSSCLTAGVATTITSGNGALIASPTSGRLEVQPLAGSGGSTALTVGTTTISGGTSGRIEYNNAGVLGELATTGSGNVVLATSPTLVTPVLGTVAAGSILTNATGLPLTTGVTGTLPVANGGTGITSFGTGVATALGTNVSGTGAICLASGSSCSGGGSGAVTLISTLTASSSASLAWTGLTTTNLADYELQCRAIVPATNAVDISVQLGEGGTPTYNTSGYEWAGSFVSVGGSQTIGAETNGNGIQVSQKGATTVGNGSPGISFILQLQGLTAQVHSFSWDGSFTTGGGGFGRTAGAGVYTTANNAITAIRVIASSGNLSTGNCSLRSKAS